MRYLSLSFSSNQTIPISPLNATVLEQTKRVKSKRGFIFLIPFYKRNDPFPLPHLPLLSSNLPNHACVSLTNSFLLALTPSSPSVSTPSSFKITCASIPSLNFLYSNSRVFGSRGGEAMKRSHWGRKVVWKEVEIRSRAAEGVEGFLAGWGCGGEGWRDVGGG